MKNNINIKSKKTILLGISLFLVIVIACITYFYIDYNKDRIIVNDETSEQICRNLCNNQTSKLTKSDTYTINYILKSFFSNMSLQYVDSDNKKYYQFNCRGEEETYIDEDTIGVYIMVYNDKENQNLTVDDCVKCVNEGNPEMQDVIEDYSIWCNNTGMQYVSAMMIVYRESSQEDDENSLYYTYGTNDFCELTSEQQYEIYKLLDETVINELGWEG